MYEYTRGILGDTTMETGSFKMLIYGKNNRVINSWYDNSGVFVNTFAPWFDRGGGHTDGSVSGMFAFNNAWGSTYERGLSFRLILTPIL